MVGRGTPQGGRMRRLLLLAMLVAAIGCGRSEIRWRDGDLAAACEAAGKSGTRVLVYFSGDW